VRLELTGEESECARSEVALIWPDTILLRARPPVLNVSR
jgi:hypothetical protein